ncbi:MAG TPA: hypothetical protein VGJ75_02430, partial [Dongiaceae bacterium]
PDPLEVRLEAEILGSRCGLSRFCLLADKAFARRIETFQEVGEERELILVVVVHDRGGRGGERGEQSRRLDLVLPGRDHEDTPTVALVANAPDEATAFEPVEGGGRRRCAQAGDLGQPTGGEPALPARGIQTLEVGRDEAELVRDGLVDE